MREPGRPVAWRLRSDLGLRPVRWSDRLFGMQCLDPAALGDVVLKRKDGLWAYQLAVVVDDAEQGISDIVRGADLLDNTPWQRQLQHALGLPTPRYLHLPLVLGPDGQKLSKQNLAPPLPLDEPAVRALLHRALLTLGQAPPHRSPRHRWPSSCAGPSPTGGWPVFPTGMTSPPPGTPPGKQ